MTASALTRATGGARPALAPAAVFAAAWAVSAAVLVVSGLGFPMFEALIGAAYLVLAAVTIRITADAPFTRAITGRRRLWAQVGIVLAFVALTAWNGVLFHQVPGAGPLPVWTSMVEALGRAGDAMFGNGNYVANPVTYALLPLLLLLLLGVRPRDLGLVRGHRTGRVILLWAAIPAVFLAVAVVTGQLTVPRLLNRLVSNTMQNGPWEEFLLRGALQTRLRALLSPAWAVVIQALVFGAWHVGLGYSTTDGAGLLPALAISIVQQGTIGLAFGIVFERTRSLIAPSVVHILVNTMG